MQARRPPSGLSVTMQGGQELRILHCKANLSMVPSCLQLWFPACVVGGCLGSLCLGVLCSTETKGPGSGSFPTPFLFSQGHSSGHLRSPILSARMSCPHVLSLSLPVVLCGPGPCGQLLHQAQSPRGKKPSEVQAGSLLVCLKAFGCLTGSGLGPAGLLWRVGRCYLTGREIESQVN